MNRSDGRLPMLPLVPSVKPRTVAKPSGSAVLDCQGGSSPTLPQGDIQMPPPFTPPSSGLRAVAYSSVASANRFDGRLPMLPLVPSVKLRTVGKRSGRRGTGLSRWVFPLPWERGTGLSSPSPPTSVRAPFYGRRARHNHDLTFYSTPGKLGRATGPFN